jgi:hypothetical protein
MSHKLQLLITALKFTNSININLQRTFQNTLYAMNKQQQ